MIHEDDLIEIEHHDVETFEVDLLGKPSDGFTLGGKN